MTPPPRGEVFALLVLAGSIATAKTQDPVAAALAADEALLAPATESTHSMPCEEHFERFVIQNVTNHTCPPASGPCAMLSVQRWGCTCKDCISEGGAVIGNCAVPARCVRNVTDEKTGRTSLSVGVLQYYEFRAGEVSDITSANRANTVAEVFRLFSMHQSERSSSISTMLAGAEPSGSGTNLLRLGEKAGFGQTPAPAVHPAWNDIDKGCGRDGGQLVGPTSCCSCTLNAEGVPSLATINRRSHGHSSISCTDDAPNNDQYCLDMAIPEGCKKLSLEEINTALQEAGLCPKSPVPLPAKLREFLTTSPMIKERSEYDSQSKPLRCVDYKIRTWLRSFSQCSKSHGWDVEWEIQPQCGVDVPGFTPEGPEYKPATAKWIKDQAMPANLACEGWCHDNPLAWCQKCGWKYCAACSACSSITFKPPAWRTILSRPKLWADLVGQNEISERPEPNLRITVLPDPPNMGVRMRDINQLDVAFKDRNNVDYISFGAAFTSWPPFRTATLLAICPTSIRTTVGVSSPENGCRSVARDGVADQRSNMCRNMGPGWCCDGIGVNRTNCRVSHSMVDAKWRRIVAEMREVVSRKAWRCGCSNGTPDLRKCYEDTSTSPGEFCARCNAGYTLQSDTCVKPGQSPSPPPPSIAGIKLDLVGSDYSAGDSKWTARVGPTATVPVGVKWNAAERAFEFSTGGDVISVNLPTNPTAMDQVSYEAWFKLPRSPGSSKAWLLSQAPDYGWSRALTLNDDRLGYTSITVGGLWNSGISTASVDEWHHVVGVWDQGGTSTVFLDGVRGNNKASTRNGAGSNSAEVFNIGGREGRDSIHNAAVFISDVRVYSRMLSESEVKALYNQGRRSAVGGV